MNNLYRDSVQILSLIRLDSFTDVFLSKYNLENHQRFGVEIFLSICPNLKRTF